MYVCMYVYMYTRLVQAPHLYLHTYLHMYIQIYVKICVLIHGQVEHMNLDIYLLSTVRRNHHQEEVYAYECVHVDICKHM